MDFALRPPEVNSALMYTGPGAGPMLADAAACDAVSAQLESAAAGYSTEVSGLTGQAWFGPSSMTMAAAATPYVAWLQTSAAQAIQSSAQADAAAAAYEAAFAATVPPPVIAANRAQLAALVATNFFGQNTPAIAATQAQYMEYWVRDATAMYTYAPDSSTASTLTPFNDPPQTTNESGQAAQARSVAQTAANTTTARTQSVLQRASTNMISAPQSQSVPVGQTVDAASGSTWITTTTPFTTSTPNATVYFTTLTIPTGSTVTLDSSAYEGSTLLSPGTVVTATSGPITLTNVAPPTNAWITTVSGPVAAVGGVYAGAITTTQAPAVFTVDAAATLLNEAGTLTLTSAGPVAPLSSGGLGAAPAAGMLSSSPGLAGTIGIQPQLDVAGLAEWARALSGGDLAAEAIAG